MRGLVEQLTALSKPLRRTHSVTDLLPLRDTLVEFEKLRVYINESLETLGRTVPCAVPQFDESWDYKPATRLDKAHTKNTTEKSED